MRTEVDLPGGHDGAFFIGDAGTPEGDDILERRAVIGRMPLATWITRRADASTA